MRSLRPPFVFLAAVVTSTALLALPGAAQDGSDPSVTSAPSPTPATTTGTNSTLPTAIVAPVTTPPVITPTPRPDNTAPPETVTGPETPLSLPDTIPAFLDPGTVPIPVGETTSTTIDPLLTTSSSSSVPDTLVPAPIDGSEIGAPEEPPSITVVLPPISITPVRNVSLEGVMAKLVGEQRARLIAARSRADQAALKANAAREELEGLLERQESSEAERVRLQSRFRRVESDLRARAVDAYTGEELQLVDVLLNSEDVSTLQRRLETVSQIQQADRRLVREYRSLQKQLETTARDLDLLLQDRRTRLAAIASEEEVLRRELELVQDGLKLLEQSDLIVQTGGFVFPVLGGASYIDSFGYPRMTGTKWSHPHQGTDLFAAYGTPLLAVQRGVAYRVGVAPLGGNRLWILTESGTAYYYAHLSCFAPGIADGVVVEAGQVVGCVGTSGNARGTPPHVHFEVHPAGYDAGALNPYPFLKAVEKADPQQLLAAFPVAATTTSVPGGATAAGGPTTTLSFGGVVADLEAGPGSTIVPPNARPVADGSVTATVQR